MSSSSTITDDLSTPGEILKEEFLEPFGLSQYEVAKRIGVDQSRISKIINGERAISADTALLLSALFGTTAEFWLRLQARHDLAQARAHTDLHAVEPVTAPV